MNRHTHKYSRLGLETLEGRSLMAGGLTSSLIGGTAGATALFGSRTPGNNAAAAIDVSGTWYINGQKCEIIQFGNQLTFVNERGERSAGYIMANGQMYATDWNNLLGTLSKDRTQITWSNGSVWDRKAPVDLSGKWYINGKVCTITQSGNNLIFTNEKGQQSQGYIRPDGSVVATNWGNLIGRLSQNNTVLTWNNGSVWKRQR